MIKQLKSRIAALQKAAMAQYESGNGFSSPTVGAERESFLKDIIEKIYPLQYRFSSGDLIDSSGISADQIDLALEFPFEPTFPSSGGTQRLMLADSIICAFEIKSSIAQFEQVKEKVSKIKKLTRDLKWTISITDDDRDPTPIKTDYLDIFHKIPVLVVFYTGPEKFETLENKYNSLPNDEKPAAILTLDKGYFISETASYQNEEGILAFFILISKLYSTIAVAQPKLDAYL